MLEVRGYAAQNATSPLAPYAFTRREVGPEDVLIDIKYCGICHSDIHQARNEWGFSQYPMVPGHEIVGVVSKVGGNVRKFKEGDLVGVGCFVDSCRECSSCKDGLEQYCEKGMVGTYSATDKNGELTQGGYSSRIVVDQNYVLSVPKNLDLAGVAPLLCAGVTTYSPLRQWKVGKLQRVGVIGLGGLGHMGVKFASSFGAEVTVFSTSRNKEADAKRLGASKFVATKEANPFAGLEASFDVLLDTVSAAHDINAYLDLLKRDGTMILVGAPPKGTEIESFSLIMRRRRLVGSLIGGIKETQEMLNYCGTHNITSDVEVIPMKDVNEAYERTLKADVKYRFVIDMKTL